MNNDYPQIGWAIIATNDDDAQIIEIKHTLDSALLPRDNAEDIAQQLRIAGYTADVFPIVDVVAIPEIPDIHDSMPKSTPPAGVGDSRPPMGTYEWMTLQDAMLDEMKRMQDD